MPDPLAKPNRPKPNPLEGAALIIVLSCLVLLAALAIGLLNRVESDRASASAYRGSTLTRNLAEYAINVVMAQISSATKSDPTLAWASQPGAIRTYSSSGSALQNIYKLYSSPDMVVAAFPSSDTSLTGWANNSALYTDLNAPVVSGGRTNYPILDPDATNSVQGFAISGAPTTTSQPAPMPVSWLYVLEDGTLAAAASSAGNNTVTVNGATAANPIVGRIAFWTDDDTCKININTASGAPWNFATSNITDNSGRNYPVNMPANYWEPPIATSKDDINLSLCPPWGGEYQRFPGHPATVSLSAVYTNLTTNQIMQIAPRVNYDNGGSKWGSVALVTNTTILTNGVKLPDDAARLYANVDELLYATNRSATGTNALTASDIERGRFFLTASSRAPDVTLFNTPRLQVWPITSSSGSTNKMTAFDRLIAFCGTVGATANIGGTNSYYFTRFDPNSPTNDYNVARNQTLLAYLRRMTTQSVPGFGGSSGILGKYNAFASGESEQITTEIFDYIRCMNCKDTSQGKTNIYFYTTNDYRSVVYPTKPSSGTGFGTMGFGRFPTISKVGLLFHFNATNYSTNAAGTTNGTNYSLCARLLMEPFITSTGWPSPSPYSTTDVPVRYVINNLDALQWGTNGSSYTNIFPTNSPAYEPYGFEQVQNAVRGGRIGIFTSPTNAINDTNQSPTFSTNANNLYFRSTGTVSLSVCYATNTNSPATWYTNQVINFNFPDFTNTVTPNANTNYNTHASWNVIGKDKRVKYISPGPTQVFFTNDVVREVCVSHGDYRLVAAQANVADTNYSTNSYYGNTNPVVQNFYATSAPMMAGVSSTGVEPIVGLYHTNSLMTNGFIVQGHYAGDLLKATNLASGDFDNSDGYFPDGPYIGFCNEGTIDTYPATPRSSAYFALGTSDNTVAQMIGPGYFSPNRLAPSAGILGSLPTGVKAGTPWQTLLFRPTALTSSSHPGANSPPDYLLLDLFNMPIVEPYAISEPLSTAGRVNMNYQILPFTWIKRSTALQAALHTEKMIAIPNAEYNNGLRGRDMGTPQVSGVIRYNLNLSTNGGTLQGFETRFSANDIFRSAAEICSIPLVPTNAPGSPTYSTMLSWWSGYKGTGDNSKERSYVRIFPKLTTKSNTYTVHYRVEVLKKNPNSSSQDTWTDGTDKVISTYRGSTTIERYVNPRDTGLPDYASIGTLPVTGATALPNFYKFRILGERQFNP